MNVYMLCNRVMHVCMLFVMYAYQVVYLCILFMYVCMYVMYFMHVM